MKAKGSVHRSVWIISYLFKKFSVLLAIFFIFEQAIQGQDEKDSSINMLDIEEFIIKMNLNENHALLDVRTWMEYKKGRIPDAIHAGSSELMSAYTDTMDFNKPLFLYCATNFRSKSAGKSLASKGFNNIYILEPGFNGWKSAGKEIEKGRPTRAMRRLKK